MTIAVGKMMMQSRQMNLMTTQEKQRMKTAEEKTGGICLFHAKSPYSKHQGCGRAAAIVVVKVFSEHARPRLGEEEAAEEEAAEEEEAAAEEVV
jgi:hypothetical protein